MNATEKLLNEYRENKRMIEELTAMNDAIRATIIAEMGDADELAAGACKATYKSIASVRFDSKAFKAEHPAEYAQYAKTTNYKRFSVL